MKFEISEEDIPAFLACIGLGTLEAIRSGTVSPEIGIWTLARPEFIMPFQNRALVPRDVLDVLQTCDELPALQKLLPANYDEIVGNLIERLQGSLRHLDSANWRITWVTEPEYTPWQIAELINRPGPLWLQGAKFSGADLNNTNLRAANLVQADLSLANLGMVDLTRADLTDANLDGANLYRANLSQAILSRAHIRRAHLNKAILYDANLKGADLEQSYLEDADLSHAHLESANLRGANLDRAELVAADLRNADLSDAWISGADFRGANLFEAILPDATALNMADFRGAILPNGSKHD